MWGVYLDDYIWTLKTKPDINQSSPQLSNTQEYTIQASTITY